MSNRILYVLPVLGFAAMCVVFALPMLEGRDPSIISSNLIDKPAPRFELSSPDVEAMPGFSHKDLENKLSLVNVFASWCATCHVEQPQLMKLAERDGLALYGIGYKDTDEDLLHWLATHGNPFDAVGMDRTGIAAIDWGVYGVPESYIVDARGRIRYKHIGPITEQDMKDTILPLLKELEAKG